MWKIALFSVLLVTVIAGCAALGKSEHFYRDNPAPHVEMTDFTSD